MLLVDTNVLVDVLQDDPTWADWSVRQLRAQAVGAGANLPSFGRFQNAEGIAATLP